MTFSLNVNLRNWGVFRVKSNIYSAELYVLLLQGATQMWDLVHGLLIPFVVVSSPGKKFILGGVWY